MATFKVDSVAPFISILAARRAVAKQTFAKEEKVQRQREYYDALVQANLLQPVRIKYTLWNSGDLSKKTKIIARPAEFVLNNCKICDEQTDPQTRDCLDILATVHNYSQEFNFNFISI